MERSTALVLMIVALMAGLIVGQQVNDYREPSGPPAPFVLEHATPISLHPAAAGQAPFAIQITVHLIPNPASSPSSPIISVNSPHTVY